MDSISSSLYLLLYSKLGVRGIDTTDVDGTQMLANLCNKRGWGRGAITKLGTRIQDLEDNPEGPNRFQAANLLFEKPEMNEKDCKRLLDEILEYIDIEEQA